MSITLRHHRLLVPGLWHVARGSRHIAHVRDGGGDGLTMPVLSRGKPKPTHGDPTDADGTNRQNAEEEADDAKHGDHPPHQPCCHREDGSARGFVIALALVSPT